MTGTIRFALTEARATLEDFNPRVEKEGADSFPAADLKLSINCSSEMLKAFEPTLEDFYFDKKGPQDLAEGFPLRDPHAVYPHARDEEMTGAIVEIGYGVGDPMPFQDSKVNTFRLTPMAGGRVIVVCRVQNRPSESQAGKLYTLQQCEITLTIKPPELPKLELPDKK